MCVYTLAKDAKDFRANWKISVVKFSVWNLVNWQKFELTGFFQKFWSFSLIYGRTSKFEELFEKLESSFHVPKFSMGLIEGVTVFAVLLVYLSRLSDTLMVQK